MGHPTAGGKLVSLRESGTGVALLISAASGAGGGGGCFLGDSGMLIPQLRAALKGVKGGLVTGNRNERSRGRSLPHGQDMGNTQNHSNSTEQRLAVGEGWRLAVGGGWQLAVGGWWSLGCS